MFRSNFQHKKPELGQPILALSIIQPNIEFFLLSLINTAVHVWPVHREKHHIDLFGLLSCPVAVTLCAVVPGPLFFYSLCLWGHTNFELFGNTTHCVPLLSFSMLSWLNNSLPGFVPILDTVTCEWYWSFNIILSESTFSIMSIFSVKFMASFQ